MNYIKITVREKRAKCNGRERIVCGNSDYVIKFDFDDEWAAYDTKTARFVYDGSKYTDVQFTGDEVGVPVLRDTRTVSVGCYAGDIRTTTAALIQAVPCCTDPDGTPADPAPDVYNQLMERFDTAVRTTKQSFTDAEKAQARKNIGAMDGAIAAEKEKWELVQELTVAEDVSAVEFAPENLNQYKKLLLEFDMNHSSAHSGGLSANGREASAYRLWKFDYGNYMNQVGQILIAPSGIPRAPTKIDGWGGNNSNKKPTPSTAHIRSAEGELQNSRQKYIYESVFPCTKLRVWHGGTIVAGSIFVLWGCK